MKGYFIEACSRAGADRDKNEDNFFAASQMASSSDEFFSIESPEKLPSPIVCIVADGLGGHEDGETASRVVIEELVTCIGEGDFKTAIAEGISSAHQKLSLMSRGRRPMGSTVVGIVLGSTQAVFFNVGDSRAYRLGQSNIEQVSEDDLSSSGSHILSQCIGGGSRLPKPHVVELQRNETETYLLMSDGVWASISDKKIMETVASSDGNSARDLCDLAVQSGSEDDCTAIVIRPKA